MNAVPSETPVAALVKSTTLLPSVLTTAISLCPACTPFKVTERVVSVLLPVSDSQLDCTIAIAVLLLIVKVWALEAPPPGAGLNTVTEAGPAVAMSAAVIAAVNWVADRYVVVRLDPFHCTTEPLMKLLPLTVRVKAEPPAVADEGLMLVVAGTGLAAAFIVKVWAFEVPPPGAGLNTVTEAVPAVAMSAAVIAAVNWVADRYVVVRLDPFHCTTEPLTKLLPLTVRVKAEPPGAAEVGLMLVVAGTGLVAVLIVKVWALEVPPPGVGLNTVTEAVPVLATSADGTVAVNCPTVQPDQLPIVGVASLVWLHSTPGLPPVTPESVRLPIKTPLTYAEIVLPTAEIFKTSPL